jgi:hypothetical protein
MSQVLLLCGARPGQSTGPTSNNLSEAAPKASTLRKQPLLLTQLLLLLLMVAAPKS